MENSAPCSSTTQNKQTVLTCLLISLTKSRSFPKHLGVDDPNAIPKPEPHCNCMRCQIARAMQEGLNGLLQEGQKQPRRNRQDEDLKFRTGTLSKPGEKLYVSLQST